MVYVQLLIFIVGSAALIHVSRGPLRQPRSHGFYRFFAWECILALIVLNLPVWDRDPFAPHQLLSWALLALSAWLPIHAVRLLRQAGKPSTARKGDAALYAFEKTTALVTRGAFRYIRHPMYTALMLLAWGAFLKHFNGLNLLLVLAATALLWMTALRDEEECLAHFGEPYRDYIRGTQRFIPFVF
ncbi:MAG: isoprenylcysteine carboxylmethyltransferase family protein [Variovorax sp.]|nr:MAG: isoprenylcysteine carboxylmethyltransferase family protein [Variovorax sp.]